MTAPHETPEFFNSAEYTVSVTFRVAGGARWKTAHRRARRIAERLANYAARTAGVVEVSAVGGPSTDGKPITREKIGFAAANSGRPITAQGTKLERYLDPEFDRALTSLAESNAAARSDREADRQRRQAIGCLNTYQQASTQDRYCLCVYCRPVEHELRTGSDRPDPLATHRCICGAVVAAAGLRCGRHRDIELVVLDSDPEPLRRIAGRHASLELPESPVEPERQEPGRDLDGPELPPLGP